MNLPLTLSDWRLLDVAAAAAVAAVTAVAAGLHVAGFRSADHELAAHELLVVQLVHGAFGVLDRLHRHEREALGLLRVLVADDLGVVHMADAGEELEQI